MNLISTDADSDQHRSTWSEEAFTVGGLGAVNSVVKAMRAMPGRKAVVLATDGFPMLERDNVRRDGLYHAEPARHRRRSSGWSTMRTGRSSCCYAVDTRRLAPLEICERR